MVHYLARYGESRVAKAALISAVPPLMVKTAANPQGLPKEVFDGLQAQLAANRSQFYRDLPAGPFYGYNRPGAKASEAVIQNWWRQGMMGGAKAHYDGIVAFSPNRFYRRPQEDYCPGVGHAQRRRPDRALCRIRAAVATVRRLRPEWSTIDSSAASDRLRSVLGSRNPAIRGIRVMRYDVIIVGAGWWARRSLTG